MQQTFRPAEIVRRLGAIYVAFFSIACVAYGSLLVLEDPFGKGRSAAPVGVMGLVIFGAMLLMSCCYLASYYIERFTIAGSTLRIRSMLRNRQFEAAAVERLRWTVLSSGGVRFRIAGASARLNLANYSKDDRLQIIRTLRVLVPHEVQEGWPMFCRKIALPLRDGKPPIIPTELAEAEFYVTRRRNDRLILTVLAFVTAVTVVLARRFQLRELLALPGLAFAAWMFLRAPVPRGGGTKLAFSPTWRNRARLLGIAGVLSLVGLLVAHRLSPANSILWNCLGIGIVVTLVPLIFVGAHHAGNERSAADEQAASGAEETWDAGEPSDWQLDSR